MLLVGLACALVLASMAIFVRVKVREAEASGVLRFHVRGTGKEHVIRQADDAHRFAIELALLRAVPWFGLALLALSFVFIGYFA